MTRWSRQWLYETLRLFNGYRVPRRGREQSVVPRRGIVLAAAVFVYSRQPINSQNIIWLFYAPVGLLLGGAFLVYRWRSFVEPLDTGLKVSTLFSDVLIDYESIRMVKVQPLPG